MGNIVNILVEAGSEPCKVNVISLHSTLLELPTKMYLKLYYMMKAEIEGRPCFALSEKRSHECIVQCLERRRRDE